MHVNLNYSLLISWHESHDTTQRLASHDAAFRGNPFHECSNFQVFQFRHALLPSMAGYVPLLLTDIQGKLMTKAVG